MKTAPEALQWLHGLDTYTNAEFGRARTLSGVRDECVGCGSFVLRLGVDRVPLEKGPGVHSVNTLPISILPAQASHDREALATGLHRCIRI